MIASLIGVVFLAIEVEIFILIFLLLKERISQLKKGKRRNCPPESPAQGDERNCPDTSGDLCSDAGQTKERPALPADSLKRPPTAETEDALSARKAAGTAVTPGTPPRVLLKKDDHLFERRDDIGRGRPAAYIQKEIICSINDQTCGSSYSSEAQLVEKEQGELRVMFLDDGTIEAMPVSELTNERILNDVLSLFFDSDMPQQLDEKKFKIRCEQRAILIKDGQTFRLKQKGRLKVDAN